MRLFFDCLDVGITHCVFAAIVVLFYLYMVKPLAYWRKQGVPQPSIATIWLEAILGFIQYRNFADTLLLGYKNFLNDKWYGAYNFSQPILAIRDPDLIKQITVKDFDHFVDHLNFAPGEDDVLWQKNLFILKGEQWREMRTALSPSFTGSKMKIMFGLMSDCAKQFVKYFEEQKDNTIVVEMKDVFTRFTNDVIATAAFGVTCDSLRNRDNEFYLMGKEITTFGGNLVDNLKFFFAIMFPAIAKFLGIRVFKKKNADFFKDIIKSNIETREKQGVSRPDMIHLLLEARKNQQKDGKGGFSDEDIAAQAFIFFLAGFDSVATLMYFMAYELALQPDLQRRLQDEIDSVKEDSNQNLTYEHLSKLKYMDMVISETLRKWPNAILLDRVCVKPYTLHPPGEKPVHLKKGDVIWFPVYAIQRDPTFYSDPDKFDPERFSDENKGNINPYLYLPFGTGPRVCIGNRFALMETKLVFFYLLSKFDLTVVDKTPIPLVLSRKVFQLDAEGGFWLGLKPREDIN